jgi:hypothetical protein
MGQMKVDSFQMTAGITPNMKIVLRAAGGLSELHPES